MGYQVVFNSSRGARFIKSSNLSGYAQIYEATFQWLLDKGFTPENGELRMDIEKNHDDIYLHVDDHVDTLKSLTLPKVLCYNQPYNQDWAGSRIFKLRGIFNEL